MSSNLTASAIQPAHDRHGAAAGASLTVLMVDIAHRHAACRLDRLAEVGMRVLMRSLAFVRRCIGLETIWTGWAEPQTPVR